MVQNHRRRLTSCAIQRMNRKRQGSTVLRQPTEGLDSVHPNADTSSQRASLFILEDNDDVKDDHKEGWIPTMRHASQTQLVGLWLVALTRSTCQLPFSSPNGYVVSSVVIRSCFGAYLNGSFCVEVEHVISVLTLVCRGVAQVFHVLLVELRLLLVVEMEDGEKEDGQEEGEEVKEGSQVEEKTTTWMAMMME